MAAVQEEKQSIQEAKQPSDPQQGNAQQNVDTDSDSDSDDANITVPENVKDIKKCWRCQQNGIQYQCLPCLCSIYCKKCAMRMATGGKCKRCGKMFVELRKVK